MRPALLALLLLSAPAALAQGAPGSDDEEPAAEAPGEPDAAPAGPAGPDATPSEADPGAPSGGPSPGAPSNEASPAAPSDEASPAAPAGGADEAGEDVATVPADPADLDPEALEPVVDELNSGNFIRSSLAGLGFMVRASEMALERPLSRDARGVAEALRDAHAELIRDLLAAMEESRRPVSEDARRIAAGEIPLDPNALDAHLAQLAARLRDEKDETFEGLWLRTMADGLESAKRWWSRYAYDAEERDVRAFADAARPAIDRLATAVEQARLRRFRP